VHKGLLIAGGFPAAAGVSLPMTPTRRAAAPSPSAAASASDPALPSWDIGASLEV